jgi:hypothetical protein
VSDLAAKLAAAYSEVDAATAPLNIPTGSQWEHLRLGSRVYVTDEGAGHFVCWAGNDGTVLGTWAVVLMDEPDAHGDQVYWWDPEEISRAA